VIDETKRLKKKDGTWRVWFRCTDCAMYGAATTDDPDDFIARTDEVHANHCRRDHLAVAT